MPKDALARFERAEAAHANGMEHAPFFIGAVLAGNLAGLDACKRFFSLERREMIRMECGLLLTYALATMNLYTGVCVGLRVLYNVLYVRTTTLKSSRARSLVWITSVASLVTLYVKAGNMMLARS